VGDVRFRSLVGFMKEFSSWYGCGRSWAVHRNTSVDVKPAALA